MTDAGSSAPSDGKTITEYELEQCQRANQTGRLGRGHGRVSAFEFGNIAPPRSVGLLTAAR